MENTGFNERKNIVALFEFESFWDALSGIKTEEATLCYHLHKGEKRRGSSKGSPQSQYQTAGKLMAGGPERYDMDSRATTIIRNKN